MARRWCLRNGRKFSTAFHTNFPAYVAVRTPAPFRSHAQALTVATLRRFHEPSSFVYVATPTLEHLLVDWGLRNRFVRLSRGVDTEAFRPDADRKADRNNPVLLYVGRVAPEKNLEAFLSLNVRGTKVVVGDGPQLSHLRHRYPDVVFRGALSGEDLFDAYREADVFVFPSKTDTFGNVLLEAMASGLSCAAYDVIGPRDIIGSNPILGAVHENLETAVMTALNAPCTRQARHDYACATYSWRQVAEKFNAHAKRVQP